MGILSSLFGGGTDTSTPTSDATPAPSGSTGFTIWCERTGRAPGADDFGDYWVSGG
jgi:hypothetical protein